MRKIMTTLLTTMALAVSTLAGQAAASTQPLPERTKAPGGATAAEALKQVTAAAKAGKGRTTASGQLFHVYSLANNNVALTSPLSSSVLALDGYSSLWRGNGSPVGLWTANASSFNTHQLWY